MTVLVVETFYAIGDIHGQISLATFAYISRLVQVSVATSFYISA